MISTSVHSAFNHAMDSRILQVESSFCKGFSGLQLIGNTSEVCRDGKERARTALEAIKIELPNRRIVVSMTPADIKKDGSHYDLPLAISMALLVNGKQPKVDTQRWLFAAELGLCGQLKPVKGVVPFAISAIQKNLDGILVAKDNLKELAVLENLNMQGMKNLRVLGCENLDHVLRWIYTADNSNLLDTSDDINQLPSLSTQKPNFDDMILSEEQRLLAMSVAVGGHSLLLRGTPGTGKSMFSLRLASILPPMHHQDHIEALRIHSSYAQHLSPALLQGRPPFRRPHHLASAQAVLGTDCAPGELSLAHGGILFLDELPEFRRDLVEALREPLESGQVRLSRSKSKTTWLANCILIAASNNCPCGWHGSQRKKCRCNMNRIKAYNQKMSGPILDRIDIHFNMPEPKNTDPNIFVQLNQSQSESSTAQMKILIKQALDYSTNRNQLLGLSIRNRDIPPDRLLEALAIEPARFEKFLKSSAKLNLTNRSMTKTLRVARTLADIDQTPSTTTDHLHQALKWQASSAAIERGDQYAGL